MSAPGSAPLVRVPRLQSFGGALTAGERVVAEETAVAFTYNGTTHAVMMATPADLEDFALGFSLSEAVIDTPAEVVSLEVIRSNLGVELRMWIADVAMNRYGARRRRLAAPVGCGLCGIESLAEAVRPAPVVTSDLTLSPSDISSAMASLPDLQWLNQEARAVHAAAFWRPAPGKAAAGNSLVALREDVGRHNALDKLAGALACSKVDASVGAVLLTSRVSVEMVQKTARLGAPVLIAISAPTALAVRTAEACGVTLVAIARGEHFEVFTHTDRIGAAQAASCTELARAAKLIPIASRTVEGLRSA
jgi:FdhD protein